MCAAWGILSLLESLIFFEWIYVLIIFVAIKNFLTMPTVLSAMMAYIILITWLSRFMWYRRACLFPFEIRRLSIINLVQWFCLWFAVYGFCLVISYLHARFLYHVLLDLDISWPARPARVWSDESTEFEWFSNISVCFFVLLMSSLALRNVFTRFFYTQIIFIICVLCIICCVQNLTDPLADINTIVESSKLVYILIFILRKCYLEYREERLHEFFWYRLCIHLFVWYCIVGCWFLICVNAPNLLVLVFLAMTIERGHNYITKHFVSQAFHSW